MADDMTAWPIRIDFDLIPWTCYPVNPAPAKAVRMALICMVGIAKQKTESVVAYLKPVAPNGHQNSPLFKADASPIAMPTCSSMC